MERVHLALISDSALLRTDCSYRQLTMPAFDMMHARFFTSYSKMRNLVPFMLKHQNVLEETCGREMGGGWGRRDDAKEQFPVLVNESNPRIRKKTLKMEAKNV